MRRCACPLEEPMDGMAESVKYRYPDVCRKRAYRAKLKREAEAVGIYVSPTLKDVEATKGTRGRPGDAESARKPTQKRRPELRVSYRKALDAVAVAIENAAPGAPLVALAENAMRSVLPPRQRATLLQRESS